ncbi:hypothetical protein [Nocardia jiangsuensis]|uniref:Uncharacterized protein n=1 Tax=Nocardia jiangsuensis TaxID=1691563 RepID=A0ABV8E0F2_9NOCA
MNPPLHGERDGAAGIALADGPANGLIMNTFSARYGQQAAMIGTRESATAYVIHAVESTGAATRADFDIDRIVSTAHALSEDWEVEALQPDTFWRIAATCLTP